MRRIWGKYDNITRQALGACFFAFLFNGVLTMMIGSALPDMKATYHLSDTQAGLMLSGHSAGNLIACFLSGLVPLWLGRRKSITILSVIAALGFIMMLVSGNPLWLITAFVLTGVGRGSISNFNNGTVNLVTGGSPTAINLLHSFFAIGAISAPLLFLLANRLSGWRAAILLTVALGVAVSFNFSRLHLPNDRPDRGDGRQKSMAFLRNRTYLILAGMLFFYLCAEYAINGWLVSYLQSKPELLAQLQAGGQEPHTALVTYSQTMATLFWAIILFGRLVSAALARRVPQKLLIMLDSIGVTAFFVLLLLNSSIVIVTIAIIGLGFCMAGICPMIYSDASYITNRYPMGTSTLLAIGSVGAILMPALVGAIADAYGFTGGMSGILIGILALLILAILNYWVKPQPVRE
jgi:fucose permease